MTPMLLASSGFSNVAVPIAGVVATLLAGVATAWVAYAVGVPRRKLLYGLRTVVQVIPSTEDHSSALELMHGGERLEHPRILKILLEGRGSRDISSQAFDSGEPIKLDVNAKIFAVLKLTSKPESLTSPKWGFNESTLHIGPSLLGKRQLLRFTVLVDGKEPKLTCKAALENVKIKPLHISFVPTKFLVPLGAAVALTLTALAVGASWISAATTSLFNAPKFATTSQATEAAFFAIFFTLAVTAIIVWAFVLLGIRAQRREQDNDDLGIWSDS